MPQKRRAMRPMVAKALCSRIRSLDKVLRGSPLVVLSKGNKV